MKKNIPPFHDFPKPELTNVVQQVRTYELITPLFGGGVNPSEVDTLTPIRGSEIRGHLRFWWRACRGGKWENLQDLKREEDKIWGKAYKKGEIAPKYDELVTIQVEIIKKNEQKFIKPFINDLEKKRSKHVRRDISAYAAFSLQASQQEFEQGDPPERSVLANITFIMTITCPERYKKDVKAALWAWETFGGIGARTRRGFGALRCTDIKENGKAKELEMPGSDRKEITNWLRDNLREYVVENGKWHEDVPHLDHSVQLCIVNPPQLPMKAWERLIGKLSAFRQIPDGRDGRSKWPEAETVRHLTRRRYYKYRPLPHPRKFPRAAFGLPIVFHFKDANKGDPEDATLQGEKLDRLSSPLILRPLLCNDGKAVGLALLLKGTRIPSDLVLMEKQGKPHQVKAELEEYEASKIEPLHGQQDVLQAFMNYLGGAIQWNRD